MSYFTFLLVFVMIPAITKCTTEEFYTLNIDAKFGDGNHVLTPFWKSTGYCPPDPHTKAADTLLSKDFLQNLAIISSLPGNQVEQVRIHYLLYLVTYDGVNFNFTKLDDLLDWLKLYGLKPGFELMGNPSGIFTDLENRTQVDLWFKLVKSLAKHYVQRYGINYVKQWNFESWNEPDYKRLVDGLNFTQESFINYYDASSMGLQAASDLLHLGGPGERIIEPETRFKYAWKLLDHCAQNVSKLNRTLGVKLDFISLHNKGNNKSINILENTIKSASLIQSLYPQLAKVPIFNDEADPLTGWNKPMSWRADVTYAAMVIKVICMHQNILRSPQNVNFTYQLHSNDNAFLNYYPYFFEQRNLLARFQMNNSITPYVEFIRKPVFMATGLLNFLGDRQIRVHLYDKQNNPVPFTENVGVLVTHQSSFDNYSLAIMLYNSADTEIINSNATININIKFSEQLLVSDFMLVKITMNNTHTNPWKIWNYMGNPKFPRRDQFKIMRAFEEPDREIILNPKLGCNNKTLSFNVTIPNPGICVIQICNKTLTFPGRVTKVRIHNITTGAIFLTWKNDKVYTKCIKTYEVHWSQHCTKDTFKQINTKDIFFNSYHHYGSSEYSDLSVTGCYKVRAVDYWGRPGPFSKTVTY